MPATTPCQPCCTTTPPVQVPGAEGDAGTNGDDGLNAYTTLTANLTVPAVGANETANVVSSAWMAIGSTIVIDGAAHFEVVSKPTATSALLTFLGYNGDVAAATVIASGATVSPSGVWGLPAPLTVYAAGTAYALTNTAALLNFGTTDPSTVITTPGTYLLMARVRLDYNGATFAAVRTVALKLRRTNNTAADITNATAGAKTDIITTLTYTMGTFVLAPVVYTTANSDDIIQIFGSIDVVPSAGSLDAVEAEIVAIRLY